MALKDRIRGYLPVVIDVETAGFNENTDALLEICAIILGLDDSRNFFPKTTLHFHIEPFKGANIEPSALKFNGIDIDINVIDSENIEVLCEVVIEGKTGVEMEALTGVNITCLTIYDMCKSSSQEMVIKEVKLLKKTGGKSDIING